MDLKKRIGHQHQQMFPNSESVQVGYSLLHPQPPAECRLPVTQLFQVRDQRRTQVGNWMMRLSLTTTTTAILNLPLSPTIPSPEMQGFPRPMILQALFLVLTTLSETTTTHRQAPPLVHRPSPSPMIMATRTARCQRHRSAYLPPDHRSFGEL